MNLQQYIETLRSRSAWNYQAAIAATEDRIDYLQREHMAVGHTQFQIANMLQAHPLHYVIESLVKNAAYNIRCAAAPDMDEGDILEYIAIGVTQSNIGCDLHILNSYVEVSDSDLD